MKLLNRTYIAKAETRYWVQKTHKYKSRQRVFRVLILALKNLRADNAEPAWLDSVIATTIETVSW